MATSDKSWNDVGLHPLAELFPEMNPDEFQSLKKDIQVNGQIEPVLLHPECLRIVDGRHRAMAVKQLGLSLQFRIFDGNPDELFQMVLSLNLKRRHLSASQKAVLALRVEEYESEKASHRRRATQNNTSGREIASEMKQRQSDSPDKVTLPYQRGQSRDIAAKLVGVSPRYISYAKKIQRMSPELLQKVTQGEMSIKRAILELKVLERSDVVSVLKRDKPNTYNVLLSDPPWDYGSTTFDNGDGLAVSHYNCMSDDEIGGILNHLQLDIAENSVCLLWTTNPMLVRALRIMEEWGFSYKTNLVWVKDRVYPPGNGYYFRGKHEILLLGIKGSFRPLTRDIVPSFLITQSRQHSRKPDEIYDIIETLYPGCNYLELFGRNRRDGWDCYGNETEKF